MNKIDPAKLIGRKVIGDIIIYLMFEEVQETYNIILRNKVDEKFLSIKI